MTHVFETYAAQLAANLSHLLEHPASWIRLRDAIDRETGNALSMYQLDLLSDMVEARLNRRPLDR